jgi:hypothetical protein
MASAKQNNNNFSILDREFTDITMDYTKKGEKTIKVLREGIQLDNPNPRLLEYFFKYSNVLKRKNDTLAAKLLQIKQKYEKLCSLIESQQLLGNDGKKIEIYNLIGENMSKIDEFDFFYQNYLEEFERTQHQVSNNKEEFINSKLIKMLFLLLEMNLYLYRNIINIYNYLVIITNFIEINLHSLIEDPTHKKKILNTHHGYQSKFMNDNIYKRNFIKKINDDKKEIYKFEKFFQSKGIDNFYERFIPALIENYKEVKKKNISINTQTQRDVIYADYLQYVKKYSTESTRSPQEHLSNLSNSGIYRKPRSIQLRPKSSKKKKCVI